MPRQHLASGTSIQMRLLSHSSCICSSSLGPPSSQLRGTYCSPLTRTLVSEPSTVCHGDCVILNYPRFQKAARATTPDSFIGFGSSKTVKMRIRLVVLAGIFCIMGHQLRPAGADPDGAHPMPLCKHRGWLIQPSTLWIVHIHSLAYRMGH